MVGTLLGLQNPTVRCKKGDVKVQMCVGGFAQLVAWSESVHLGLETFLVGAGIDSTSTSTSASASDQHAPPHREVREVTARSTTPQWHPPPNIGGLIDLPSASAAPTPIRISCDGRAAWTAATHGHAVMRRIVEPGRVCRESEDLRSKGGGDERVWRILWEECAGLGLRGWVRESEEGPVVNRMLNKMFGIVN